jgi:serine/threonine protein kinase
VKKAAKYFKLSADRGNCDAQYSYGVCLEKGEGVAQNVRGAVKYFKLSADRGNPDAQLRYAFYTDKEEKVYEAGKDPKLSADQGISDAQQSHEISVEEGEGVDELAEPSNDHKENVHVDARPRKGVSDLLMELGPEYVEFTMEAEFEPGNCSIMKFVRNRETGEELAVKTLIIPRTAHRDEVQKQFMSELQALLQLDHRCIVQVKGCSLPTATEGPTIITEYVGGGTLKILLRSDVTHPRWWNATRKVITIMGIVLGMEFIHSKNLIHRDLKPTNILLDDDHNVKISDFGSSRIYQVDVTLTGAGTPLYMAPEVLEGHYDQKVDVYSFGLILYEICAGNGVFSSPKNETSRLKLYVDLQKGNPPPIPDSVLPVASTLIAECWAASASKRPSFSQIRKRLQEIDFKILPGVDSLAVEAFVITNEQHLKRSGQ